MADEDAALSLVIVILSKVWRTFASIDTMCSLILQQSSSPPSIDKFISVNQQVSVWSEQTAISLISFLRQISTEEIITEVQAIARNVAMTTRSFNQHLRQKSIVSPLEGILSTPQKFVTGENVPSLPADFFLPTPSPPHSTDSTNSQDDASDTSNTSLV